MKVLQTWVIVHAYIPVRCMDCGADTRIDIVSLKALERPEIMDFPFRCTCGVSFRVTATDVKTFIDWQKEAGL